jgi:hypothetical protein
MWECLLTSATDPLALKRQTRLGRKARNSALEINRARKKDFRSYDAIVASPRRAGWGSCSHSAESWQAVARDVTTQTEKGKKWAFLPAESILEKLPERQCRLNVSWNQSAREHSELPDIETRLKTRYVPAVQEPSPWDDITVPGIPQELVPQAARWGKLSAWAHKHFGNVATVILSPRGEHNHKWCPACLFKNVHSDAVDVSKWSLLSERVNASRFHW